MNTSIAQTIKNQCTVMGLATVGAHHFKNLERGLSFHARILPLTSEGRRGQYPMNMIVTITLNFEDLYDVRVEYDRTLHYSGCDFYFDQLPKLLLALDYDGPETLNPRYA
jgi:hypothetical protein